MLYENKYKIGDLVKSQLDEIKTGKIKCVIEKSSNNGVHYSYLIYNEDGKKYFIEFENYIKLVRGVTPEDDSDSIKSTRQIIESWGYDTSLKVGDVVVFRNSLTGEYAVSSIIETAYGEEIYHYELVPTTKKHSLTDESYVCGGLMLEFQYHDKQWEQYFAESVRNGLPAWRGELYNFYMFYNDFKGHKELDFNHMEDYNNDTIPPMFMKHILDEHSIYRRIDEVLKSPENISKIERRLKIDKSERLQLVASIKNKINARNLRGVDPSAFDGNPNKADFTGTEMNFVAEIDKLDIVTKNHQRIIEDHYPVYMSNWQIMDAIKEAYLNASKTGSIIMQSVRDRRGDEENAETGEVVEPVKGKRTYRGESKKYGLVIEFWYNFDLNLIESAYPLRMNNNSKKH